ncbi:ATP-binding protein [Paracoccus sanguinis]|uniref:ATP-binding protein n=1 Tax=Paracoccus sanguinis TaxID=1545044 RepID=UPI000B2E9BBB|nr:ATP-binding protein [Paracoccus sanguinis]
MSAGAGFHRDFNIERFDFEERLALQRLSKNFFITRDGHISVGKSSQYRFALIKPVAEFTAALHTEREVMVLFSNHSEFQARALDAFDHIIASTSEAFRIEKIARILVGRDEKIVGRLEAMLRGNPDAPVVIPFKCRELNKDAPDDELLNRIRAFTFSRDLFSLSSPLKSDLYFYGRGDLINEIFSKLMSGENYGIFGLRRSGKTSLINGVYRALEGRQAAPIVVDCSLPATHLSRWNELLFHIIQGLRNRFSLNKEIGREGDYSPTKASASFIRDISIVKAKSKRETVALLFDEIEQISPGTSPTRHWNADEDALFFWQTLRSGFQHQASPYTFLIAGTNPAIAEVARFRGADNPLYQNVQKRYIPMFDYPKVADMVSELGAFMGIKFDYRCLHQMHTDFGGHPFLIRQFCSKLADIYSRRPLFVDPTMYENTRAEFAATASSSVDSILDLLKRQYEIEYELLDMLGRGDLVKFNEIVADDPHFTEHLVGYGLIKRGEEGYFFNIGVVEEYFAAMRKPVHLLGKEARRAEISDRRNRIEEALRDEIRSVFKANFSKADRREQLVAIVPSERRAKLDKYTFEELLSPHTALFFLDYKQLIEKHYEKFKNSFNITKEQFSVYASDINFQRKPDAHAGEIGDLDFEKIRVSLGVLERELGLESD